MMGWRQIWRLARRDLNGRFRGLRLLLVCLFLGVATLATIGSLTTAITSELSRQGQSILGGDVEVTMSQRQAGPDELAAMRAGGALSATVRMQAMAQRESFAKAGNKAALVADSVLVELKGVDRAYPLFGDLRTKQGRPPLLGPDDVLVGQGVVDRLGVQPGERLRLGNSDFEIVGIIAQEPDRLGEGFTLGPVALMSLEGLARTGLIQPGSLYESKYRLRIGPTASPDAEVARLREQFPDAGWEFRTREGAAPATERFILRLGQFLTLVGLAALVIAGIGVGNGVASYLAGKRGAIATFKVLGAQSGDILRLYLMQIGAVAALAIGAGLIAGIILPPLIIAQAGDILPVRPGFAIYPMPLATSAAYGLLIALIFALPPLARARHIPAAGLFRSAVERVGPPDRTTMAVMASATALIIALALFNARDPLFSAGFIGAALAILALLAAVGWAVRKVASRLPRSRAPLLRLAIANLHRPGAQTGQLVVALGLGLTLFVTLASIQTSLGNEISRTVPARAPNLFVLDIPKDQQDEFLGLVNGAAPDAALNTVPALRGIITGFGSTRVADLPDIPDNAWVLRGERGLTYSPTLPEGSELVAGKWWPADYDGPPLVSIDQEMARTLNLKIGDMLTVSLLGREISARIASFRKVNWDTMGFNYVMVFSPNALRDAPHNIAATVALDESDATPGEERDITRAILADFPAASVINVGDLIVQVQTILGQLAAAVAVAASIAIFSGIAVLTGAIAASRQSRLYDSVILKTLGATRGQILLAQLIEYALLALLLALVALGFGLLAGWYVIVEIFQFNWSPDWMTVLATLAAGVLLTLGLGLLGSLPVLSVRPARALRQL